MKGENLLKFKGDEFLRGLWEGTNSDWVKWIHRNLSDRHCPECLMLDNCWFLRSKAPPWPHHPYCHCLLESISRDLVSKNAIAKSNFSKFAPYLFDPENFYKHGKNKLFESWGYSISDSEWLQKEFEKQALEKYIKGNYNLGKLSKDGQRISIRIEIARKDTGNIVSFVTGWMVYPNGHIQLNTPYGGK